jgi:hypothetical protein
MKAAMAMFEDDMMVEEAKQVNSADAKTYN